MGNSYKEQYKDSRWQKKRLEIMRRDNWRCQSCGASGEGTTLNVHHAYYVKRKAPWDYGDAMLVTWCEPCHASRHEDIKVMQRLLTRLTYDDFSSLFALFTELINSPEQLSNVRCLCEYIEGVNNDYRLTLTKEREGNHE